MLTEPLRHYAGGINPADVPAAMSHGTVLRPIAESSRLARAVEREKWVDAPRPPRSTYAFLETETWIFEYATELVNQPISHTPAC